MGEYTNAMQEANPPQRYRSFITKIINARLVVMMLAMMMGQASIKTP
jgi:hypothetical protein